MADKFVKILTQIGESGGLCFSLHRLSLEPQAKHKQTFNYIHVRLVIVNHYSVTLSPSLWQTFDLKVVGR